jgi:predicted permease
MSDLQSAIRSLVRAPGFTAGAVLTCALGIGVSVAVFAAVDRILLRPLPYASPGELVLLRECRPGGNCNGRFPSALAYEGRTALTTLGETAVAGLASVYELTPTAGDSPALTFIGISSNLLRVLGVRPALGRDVVDDDVQAKQRVVFLSDATWRLHFGADPGVIGRQLWRGTQAATIIGVLPAGFVQPGWVSAPVWHGLAVEHSGWSTIGPTGAINPPIARLRPGATLEAARAEVHALHLAIEAAAPQAPATPRPATPVGIRVDRLEDALFSRFTDHVWLVVASAGLVAAMAVVNLAALLLARARARERDIALRATLGASRARLVRGSVLEAGLLACLSAAVAGFALWLVQEGLSAALPPLFRQNFTLVTETRVLIFAVGVALACALAAGLWPGLVARRAGLLALLQHGAPAVSPRLPGGRMILGVQAAVCVILVLGAAIMVRSFTRLVGEDLGFVPDDLYRLGVTARERPQPAVALQDYRAVLDVVGRLPGVAGVAGGDSVHTAPETAFRGFVHGEVQGAMFEIGAGYFRVLGSRLLAGREFTPDEIAGRSPVGILSAGAVQQLWPGRAVESVVGESFAPLKGPVRQIVGVVQDLREHYGETPRPALFVPLGSAPAVYNTVLVRVEPGVQPSLADWRQQIVSRMGARTVRLAPAAAGTTALADEPRFRALLLSVFGIAALVLAAAGLYALTSLDVARRRTEVGVRLALGATKTSVLRGLVLSALRPVAIGCAVGLIAAYWIGAWAQSFLYHVDARDPLTMMLAVVVLVSAAGLAAWLPARRAARVDPIVTLRTQ